jgi:hypothetical protein
MGPQQISLLTILLLIFLLDPKIRGRISFWYYLSVIVTVISVIFLINNFVDKNEMLQRVGLVGVLAYSIGAILGAVIIPLFLWAIYFVLKIVHNKKLLKLKQETIIKISNSVEFSQEFNIKLNALKDLLDVQAITQKEFLSKEKLLITETESLVLSMENMQLKQKQLDQLALALDAGVITEEEYRLKLDSLK